METSSKLIQSTSGISCGVQPTKEELGKYIHDIAELEKKIFTIDKTIQNSRLELNRAQDELQREMDSARSAYEYAKAQTNNAEIHKKETIEAIDNGAKNALVKKPVKKVVVEDTRFFGKRLTAAIFGFLIFIFSISVATVIKTWIVVPIGLGIAVFLFLMGAIKDKKRRKHYKKHEYPKQIEKAETDFLKAMEKYAQEREQIIQEIEDNYQKKATEELRLGKKIIELKLKKENIEAWSKKLNEEIDKVIPHREILTNQMHKLYSFNLIPPDYREVDCTMMFDQIFRNDLADNMREAVKIYEERIFRGDVIRGIDKIYGMLGQLNTSMMQIGRNLESVKEQVSFMSNDLCHMVTLTEEANEHQRAILRETELNRYAVESVRSSTENLEYYVKRWDT